MKNNYKEIKKCRICGCKDLVEAISLEPQFLSPTFVKSNKKNHLAEIKVPMTVVVCQNESCSLVQLKESTNPELLYTNYFYRSSTNDMMKEDLKKVVVKSQEQVEIKANDVVVDIGANDCTMIQWFPEDAKRIGVEPAKNIDWTSVSPSINIVNDFFPSSKFSETLDGNKVKIFTSCAMFYDLDDPNAFVKSIKDHLHKDGVWCIQLSYALSMIKNKNFYDICHEHLEYYTLKTLRFLMRENGLHLYHAEENRVNGGSALVFISHIDKKRPNSKTLLNLLIEEESMGLYDVKAYENFYKNMNQLKDKVNNYISEENKKGNYVLGLGASTKGNVLLQFFDLNKNKIPAISERQKEKIGLKTLGSDIDLISEEEAHKRNPSCMLVLPWYFKEEIIKREKEYLLNGGALLFPMPYVHLITNDGEIKL
ncbi:class I SAM-dependent methyltransferase [Methylophilales bacterium]|nr:class I SAM-dependent methyltransferase [Methylophilales bacterium]